MQIEQKIQLQNTIAILLIFEPIELPRAIAGASLIIDEMLTNISGIDVPRATRVMPITTSLIPNFVPSWEL